MQEIRHAERSENRQSLPFSGTASTLPAASGKEDSKKFLAAGEPWLNGWPSKGLSAAQAIAALLLGCRKPIEGGCSFAACPRCQEILASRLRPVVQSGKKLEMVISAFPYKIPNPRKTASDLPDMSERQALLCLARHCHDIGEVYSPGASLVIGSDGLPFCHVDATWSGLMEGQIRRYVEELRGMAAEVGAEGLICVVALDDFFGGFGDAEKMRRELEARHATLGREQVYERFKDSKMYKGIKKSFCEDLADAPMMQEKIADGSLSKKGLRRLASDLAVETIYYSLAWRQFLSGQFPGALRLSIHPECLHTTPPGQEKLGVSFGENNKVWFADKVFEVAEDETIDISPWQSVWVEDERTGQGCRMKRWVAEKIGGRLVTVNGRPSHFVMDAP